MLFVDISKQFGDRLDFDLNLLMIGLNFDAFLSRESGFLWWWILKNCGRRLVGQTFGLLAAAAYTTLQFY